MADPRDPRLLVVVMGGKALGQPGRAAKPGEWSQALARSLPPLVDLVAAGFRLVLTHGHGRQVDDELRRMDLAAKHVPPRSLDLCAAGLQGALGYAIQQVFGYLCRARGLTVATATVVTRVVVDADDPAFGRPTVPVGPLYTRARARQLARQKGWAFVGEARRGFRRIVASPLPARVLDAEPVRRLAQAGIVPIACGGGGIPVVETEAGYRGVEAVIEMERAAAALAGAVGADRLLVLTGVERATVRFGTPQEIGIERLTVKEARALLAAGEFPARSMGPKVEASVRFVEAGGREAIITSIDRAQAAIDGDAGTHVVP